jgi:hypothetical protein
MATSLGKQHLNNLWPRCHLTRLIMHHLWLLHDASFSSLRGEGACTVRCYVNTLVKKTDITISLVGPITSTELIGRLLCTIDMEVIIAEDDNIVLRCSDGSRPSLEPTSAPSEVAGAARRSVKDATAYSSDTSAQYSSNTSALTTA